MWLSWGMGHFALELVVRERVCGTEERERERETHSERL